MTRNLADALHTHHRTADDPWHRAISMITDGSPDGPSTRALRVEADILRDEGDAHGAELLDRLADLNRDERREVLSVLFGR